MKTENWQTVKEILHAVRQIEPARRAGFLEQSAATFEVRAEVESLLECEAASRDFMSLPITDFSKDFAARGAEYNAEEEISLAGQKIGIYEIVKEIGFGGMGAVYLANRCDGKFEQKVAIKMLKREFNTEPIRRYFRRERKIQARLNHPNIARLLDAETTGDAVPYLVLEYIKGVPIDEYCARENLSLNARLKLFNRVCDAVMHAHRNLTVHRDLKPSNILVNETGEPKLLDFGISKLLEAGSSEAKPTIFGAMTPEYASPEQIRGEPVTTATDIYSLGVILYKILTDSHPFNLKGKTGGELLAVITQNEPTLPSAVLSEKAASNLTAAGDGDRKVEKSSVKIQSPVAVIGSDISPSQLKGDLDNIILKSLAKTPERRYQTVEQFSADIWRFVDGLPVLARPATFSYQARKFYGRHRLAVFAGVFVLVSLLTGLTVALWQTGVARGQARIASDARRFAEIETERAVDEAAKAKSEAEKARRIAAFMSKIIAYANPAWYAEGAKFNGETKVITVLSELGREIDIEFAGQPDIQAELHHKFAEVYNVQQQIPGGEKYNEKVLFHARRAVEWRQQFYGEWHELVAKDMFYLWTAGGVDEANEAEHLAEAIQMMRETNSQNLNLPYLLEAYTSRLMLPDAPDKHERFRLAARSSINENKYQIAERYLLESLPLYREHYREDNLAIYANECKLAYAQIKLNKSAEAAPHLQICREALTKIKNENQIKAIKTYLSQIEAAENNH